MQILENFVLGKFEYFLKENIFLKMEYFFVTRALLMKTVFYKYINFNIPKIQACELTLLEAETRCTR